MKSQEGTMAADWLPGALGGGAIALVLSGIQGLFKWRDRSAKQEGAGAVEKLMSDHNFSTLRQDVQDLRADFKTGMDEIRSLADASARLQSSQGVVNQINAKGMDALVERQDQHAAMLADHTATIRLLVDKVMTK